MFGWTGKILILDLTKQRFKTWSYEKELAYNYIGGRGFAIKILWDLLPRGIDPLSPENILVIAAGPLTGLPIPSSGKIVIASKSPLTNGYGDGNIGTLASVKMRYAGYDAIVIKGKSKRPIYIFIENDTVDFISADELWGLNTFDAEKKIIEKHGRNVGILLIGPAGENQVSFSTIISQQGRSGGRPGIGAVMGSKNLKAIVLEGNKMPDLYDIKNLRKLSSEAYNTIIKSKLYDLWKRQGTMATIVWSNENSVLPVMNFSEGVFDKYQEISGDVMEKMKIDQRGCPMCNAQCGNVIEDFEDFPVELDYENVAMLGSNLFLSNLRKIGVFNRLADMYGVDTISLGNVLGFAIEISERKILKDLSLEWGDFKGIRKMIDDIVYRREYGKIFSQGVHKASKVIGKEAEEIAMHVKGLEVSGYDCHAAPGMALSYGTSPIGAHHKDAWVISWEAQHDRLSYDNEKVQKVIQLQRIRGGLFEVLVSCRFPWVEIGLGLEWYPKLLKAATGVNYSLDYLTHIIGDRIYALIRLFWIREIGNWDRSYDYPPKKWFSKPLTKGLFKGIKLDPAKYDKMLTTYYSERGWDNRGIPKKSTLINLGLSKEADYIQGIIPLSP
ncbi:MAG: aldehyde ferredoxin oxidoreductase family protein [Thermoproteales archaeon]|nr:aldehyde ferredoxin oxidoreductase family protein [Thermoproteales archaeon]